MSRNDLGVDSNVPGIGTLHRTKTGMDRLPTVTGETATGFRPVFIWTGPKLEVTGCNWPGSMTSKCLLMHPPYQHLLSMA